MSEPGQDKTPPEGVDWERLVELMFSDAAFWQLVFLIGATLLASLWNLNAIRQTTFEWLGDERDGRVEAALDDPSDAIASRACSIVLTDEEGLVPVDLFLTLYSRPEVAFSCIEQANAIVEARRQSEDEQASDEPEASADARQHNPFYRPKYDLVPRHQVMASALGGRWMSDLFEGTSNACATAYDARRAVEQAGLDPTYRLMSCAVAADSEDVRQCCIKELGGHDKFIELLGRPDLVPIREAGFDLRALVGAAFPSVPTAKITLDRRRKPGDDEAPYEPVEDGEERFGDLQFDVQDWVVDVGCRLHFEQASRRKVPATFVPLVESDECAPTDPPWSGMYSATSWTKACMGMYSYRRELAFTPRQALCESLGRATLDQSISVASIIVQGALGEASLTPGVAREKLEIVGDDSFGERLYGFQHGEPVDKDEEPSSNWMGDGTVSPLGGM